MSLVEHAKKELELMGAFSDEGDFYGGMTGKSVMELMDVFAEQGHSGMSAGIVRNLFNKLANYEPLSPLTFADDEWNENDFGGDTSFQNKRNSAVFKDSKDAKPHYIDAYTMCGETGVWNGSLVLEGDKRVGRCYIKDPSDMPTIKIELDIVRHSDDGGDWDFVPAPMSVLDELKNHYDVDIIDVT